MLFIKNKINVPQLTPTSYRLAFLITPSCYLFSDGIARSRRWQPRPPIASLS